MPAAPAVIVGGGLAWLRGKTQLLQSSFPAPSRPVYIAKW